MLSEFLYKDAFKNISKQVNYFQFVTQKFPLAKANGNEECYAKTNGIEKC
ncbi:MAG: hypothetical protein R3A12_09085 [Ignavibacteria bacterium]|nr:hypothetical protein [Ignavibacteriota bacterium]